MCGGKTVSVPLQVAALRSTDEIVDDPVEV